MKLTFRDIELPLRGGASHAAAGDLRAISARAGAGEVAGVGRAWVLCSRPEISILDPSTAAATVIARYSEVQSLGDNLARGRALRIGPRTRTLENHLRCMTWRQASGLRVRVEPLCKLVGSHQTNIATHRRLERRTLFASWYASLVGMIHHNLLHYGRSGAPQCLNRCGLHVLDRYAVTRRPPSA